MNQLSHLSRDYNDIVEQVFHDMRLCKFMDTVHDPEIGYKSLGEQFRAHLEKWGYEIVEKNDKNNSTNTK